MHRRIGLLMFLSLVAFLVFVFGVQTILAQSHGVTTTLLVPCTNYNYSTSPRCSESPVDWFLSDEAGGFYGQLLSGVQFTQRPVHGDLHRFQLEKAFWFIDREGSFYASSTLQAASISMARGSM